ncbi:MAG: hypothetical protein IJY05_03135 [Clostridia bacterium]|nr:hypothetical protein [Clostridia bacterium]
MKKQNFEIMSDKLAGFMDGVDGKKITVVCMSDFGGVCVFRARLHCVQMRGYAQYKNGVWLTVTRERKRKKETFIFHENKDFAIFADWCETSAARPNCWTCFDKELFYKVVDGVNGEKLAENSERVYMPALESMGKVYRVIKGFGVGNVEEYENEAELLSLYEKSGVLRDNVRRFELQGSPILKGLCGPMFDGHENGRAVIRYETQEVCDILSN